ncbi:Gfo/Idh/MocA family protein [Brachybacterium subflavum]|uniref:Gfo/Idh/MocA family protein n=1 Tax=Brachybacterium subflavum TaxID=2585206 RepID=UPI00126626CA|nr:Gfo/Idh/MocA family oxidoreductase [Brachybacterium subflavum]
MTTVRVGLIGCGNVALNFHVPAYQALPGTFEIVGLADPTPERLELGRTTAGLTPEQVHADALDLIAREDIDVIDVCTPQHLHRDLVIAAARAGKHVMSEKPLAAIPAEAADMVDAARAAGVQLATMHNYLLFPEIRALADLIASGEIGQVRSVAVDMLGVVDAAGASGYRPQWRKDPAASGGGVLIDMLHGVYLTQHLLGREVEGVSAWIDAAPGDAVESLALARLEAGDRAGLVNIGWGMGPGGIRVDGTAGRAILHYRADGTIPWAPFESLDVTTAEGTRALDLPAGQELDGLIADSMRDLLADLAAAIHEHRAPAADGAAALHVLETVVAAYGSAALGRTVGLPLETTGPLHRAGVTGIPDLDVPGTSRLRELGVFGLHAAEAAMA